MFNHSWMCTVSVICDFLCSTAGWIDFSCLNITITPHHLVAQWIGHQTESDVVLGSNLGISLSGTGGASCNIATGGLEHQAATGFNSLKSLA